MSWTWARFALATARLWSRGVSRQDSDGLTLVRIGFQLVNLGETPIELDVKSLSLEEVVLDDRTSYRIPPLRVDGSTRVAPSFRQEIEVSFSLPGQPDPGAVHSYRLAWSVRDGGTYTARTLFVAAHERPRSHPHTAHSYGYYWVVYPWPYYGWPYFGYGWPYAAYGAPYYDYGWPTRACMMLAILAAPSAGATASVVSAPCCCLAQVVPVSPDAAVRPTLGQRYF
ncbi:MAG: hypothetical protein ABI895_22795 [Deltaproteobacteria bacterium]